MGHREVEAIDNLNKMLEEAFRRIAESLERREGIFHSERATPPPVECRLVTHPDEGQSCQEHTYDADEWCTGCRDDYVAADIDKPPPPTLRIGHAQYCGVIQAALAGADRPFETTKCDGPPTCDHDAVGLLVEALCTYRDAPIKSDLRAAAWWTIWSRLDALAAIKGE